MTRALVSTVSNQRKQGYSHSDKPKPKSERRRKRGPKANVRRMKRLVFAAQQRTCYETQQRPFKRLVRAIASAIQLEFGGDAPKLQRGVVPMLRTATEARIVRTFGKASLVAEHAGRSGVNTTDVDLVWKLGCDNVNI